MRQITHIKLPKPKAIFFDWDGTIIKFNEKKIVGSINHALRKFGSNVQLEDLRNSKSISSTLLQHLGSQNFSNGYIAFKQHFAAQVVSRDELMPSIEGFLENIKQREILAAIVSNLDKELLAPQLKALDLNKYFNLVIGAAQKPAANKLLEASDLLNLVHNKNIWFIGDSIHTDIVAANKAGFTSCFLNTSAIHLVDGREDIKKPDITISNFNEFSKILDHVLTSSGREFRQVRQTALAVGKLSSTSP